MNNYILEDILDELKKLRKENKEIKEQLIEVKEQLNRIEDKQEKIFVIVKRSETKLSHTMDVFEVNTKEPAPALFFIENNEEVFDLKIKHKDVTVSQLEEFFKDKNGLFVIEVGEQQWKIIL